MIIQKKVQIYASDKLENIFLYHTSPR